LHFFFYSSDDDEAAAAAPTAADAAAGDSAGTPGVAGGPVGGDALSRKRAMKEKWHEGVALFNKKPKKGISFLQVGRGAG
jgi:brefeldin A-inhibited guanine nucleotide-exchange protein